MALWSFSWLCSPRSAGKSAPGSRVASCHVIALPNHLPLPVTIRALSAKSLDLVSPNAVESGSSLAVTLEGARGFKRLVRACVVQATPRHDGDWVLDCQIIRQLTGEELIALR